MHISEDSQNNDDPGAVITDVTKTRSLGTVFSSKRISQWSSMELGEFSRNDFPMEWSIRRRTAAATVLNPIFDIFIGVIVMVNIGLIVHQTNLSGMGRPPDEVLEWVIFGMLIVYTLEAFLRLYAFRLDYFFSAWNLMDFGVLVADWTLQIVTWVTVEEVPRATVLRTLRVLRALRVLRTIRTLQLFRELYIMLYGFFSALKAIAWAAVLILLILLIWGIMAVEMIHPLNLELVAQNSDIFGDCTRCHRAFETVHASVLTFAQQIVAGDSWGRVTIPLMEAHPWTAPYFIMVFVTIDLGLLNLILSVIVDKAHQAHQEDVKFQMAKRQKDLDYSKKKLTDLCSLLDEDMSGCLSLDELLSGYDRLPEFQDQMRRMDVEREDMLSLFKCLDADQSGDILYTEFVEQVVKMRSQDVTLSLMFLRSQIKEIKLATLTMSKDLEELKRKYSPNGELPLPVLDKPVDAHFLPGSGIPTRRVSSVSTQTQTEDWPLNGHGLNGDSSPSSPFKAPEALKPEVASWHSQVRSMREALLRLESDMAGYEDSTALLQQQHLQQAETRVDDLFASRCCSPARRAPERLEANGKSKHSRV